VHLAATQLRATSRLRSSPLHASSSRLEIDPPPVEPTHAPEGAAARIQEGGEGEAGGRLKGGVGVHGGEGGESGERATMSVMDDETKLKALLYLLQLGYSQ